MEGDDTVKKCSPYKMYSYIQGINQKNYNWGHLAPIGKVNVASMHAIACPNVAGGSGGALSPPLPPPPQQGSSGTEPPRKNLKALNCV